MAWTAPAAPGSVVLTNSFWTTQVTNNLLETGPAKVTTAGDLVYATGPNALARLGIGSALQVLRTNAGATAPEWVDPASALTVPWEEIGTSEPASDQTTITFASISGSYHFLRLTGFMPSVGGGNVPWVRFNNDAAGSDYHTTVGEYASGTSWVGGTQGALNQIELVDSSLVSSSVAALAFQMLILFGTEAADYPVCFWDAAFWTSSVASSNFRRSAGAAALVVAGAVTEIDILTSGGANTIESGSRFVLEGNLSAP